MSGTNIENGPMDANMRQAKASGIGRSCAVLLQQAHGRVKAGPLLSSETSGAGRAGAAIAPTNLTGNQVLKCPRCNSLNTKFCYYNNYSLLQPRHFCKNCRRYWTKGGALRNVPVGGGCRKNKRGTSEGGSATATSSARSSKQGLSMISSTLDKDVSCRNIISAHLLAAVPSRSHSDLRVQPCAGLQHSFTTPAPTHLPSLYNYSSKTSLIQPSLSNSHLNIAQLSPSSNRTQYVQPHADHVLSPHHGSFHSFLNLKQAISSLASPNHLNNIPVMLPAHSLLPSPFNYDHISTPANFTQAMQAPISNQPFLGLDLINMTSPKPAGTPSTITTTPAGGMLRNSSSSALHEGFNQSDGQDDHVQIRADLHQSTGMKISRDQQMMISKELQPFRSSPLITSTSLHQLQAVSMSEHRQLIMPSSPSMKAHELVSDNFKMKGDQLPDQPAAQAVACTASWVGQGNGINSFLEPSEDETFWSCNPSSWPDDL